MHEFMMSGSILSFIISVVGIVFGFIKYITHIKTKNMDELIKKIESSKDEKLKKELLEILKNKYEK